MRVEPQDIGHKRRVIVTRNDWGLLEAEGMLWYNNRDTDRYSIGWYFLSNDPEWDGNRAKGLPYDDYRYSWVLVDGRDYDTLSPMMSMDIKKKIKKHKMMTMT